MLEHEHMTPREAAARLRVSVRTLDRYAAAGAIHADYLPSGYRRFRTQDVEALLQHGGAA